MRDRKDLESHINTPDDHAEAVEEKEWKMTEPSDFSFWMCGDATKIVNEREEKEWLMSPVRDVLTFSCPWNVVVGHKL